MSTNLSLCPTCNHCLLKFSLTQSHSRADPKKGATAHLTWDANQTQRRPVGGLRWFHCQLSSGTVRKASDIVRDSFHNLSTCFTSCPLPGGELRQHSEQTVAEPASSPLLLHNQTPHPQKNLTPPWLDTHALIHRPHRRKVTAAL